MKITTLRKMLLKEQARGVAIASVMEFILLTTLPLSSGFLFHPGDPFFLQSRFPLLLLPPLLLALRYGLMIGLASFAVIMLWVTGAYYHQIGHIGEYPSQLLFGTLAVTLLAGEITNYLQAKIRRSEAEVKLLMMRFDEFTNAYHVMKVSHDHLKEQLATTTFSLREALQIVREKLQKQYKDGQRGLNQQVGNDLLAIFQYFCSTQIAGIYGIDETGTLTKQPLAVQGNMAELKEDDQLVRGALTHGALVSILPKMHGRESSEEPITDLLAVIPIKDISGHLWGIVAVSEINFSAFQAENLNLMQLIGSYAGNLFSQAENIFYAEGDKQAFIAELESIWRLAKESDVISSLISITFHKILLPHEDFETAIIKRIRGLDHIWLYNKKKQLVIFLLMPLMTSSEYFNFRKSLNASLRERFGYGVEEAGGLFHHLEIQGSHRFSDYVAFIEEKINSGTHPDFSLWPGLATVTPNLEKSFAKISVLSAINQPLITTRDGQHEH